MKMRFGFKLGDAVKITTSGESGVVIGRAEYTTCEPQMQVRYKTTDGRAIESWWTQSALEAV